MTPRQVRAWRPMWTRDYGWVWLRKVWVPGNVVDLDVMLHHDYEGWRP